MASSVARNAVTQPRSTGARAAASSSSESPRAFSSGTSCSCRSSISESPATSLVSTRARAIRPAAKNSRNAPAAATVQTTAALARRKSSSTRPATRSRAPAVRRRGWLGPRRLSPRVRWRTPSTMKETARKMTRALPLRSGAPRSSPAISSVTAPSRHADSRSAAVGRRWPCTHSRIAPAIRHSPTDVSGLAAGRKGARMERPASTVNVAAIPRRWDTSRQSNMGRSYSRGTLASGSE